MSVFVIIAVAIIALVVMLRFKVPLGPAILGSGLILWVFTNPAPHLIWDAAVQMVTQLRTWDLLAALYFVVCLEIELRNPRRSARLHRREGSPQARECRSRECR